MTHDQLNLLLEQIRHPDKRTWILMVPNSLGETVVVCGLASGFIKKHGYGITLVIPDSHTFIPQCFPDTFDRIVGLNLGVMRQFSEKGFIPQNFFKVDFPINTWPEQHGDGRIRALHDRWQSSFGNSGLSLLDMYRYILRLDWGSEFIAPIVPEKSYSDANELIAKLNIKHKKTVVLFIGNNTAKPSPAYLWEQTAKLYSEQGYDVLINKYGAMLLPENLSIPNATVVDIPLNLAIPICEYAGNAVMGANGFVLFAIASKMDCNMNVLMPNEICYDWNKFLYKEIDFMTGCHQLGMPELTCNLKNFREWIVPREPDSQALDEIARGIVFGINNEYTIPNGSS